MMGHYRKELERDKKELGRYSSEPKKPIKFDLLVQIQVLLSYSLCKPGLGRCS